MITLSLKFLPFWRARKSLSNGPLIEAAPVTRGNPTCIQINEGSGRPPVALFQTRRSALEKARQLGATWQPIAYACGYLVTNGWSFQDAKNRVANFCPLPPMVLATIRDLVIRLKQEQVPAGELPARILHRLQRESALAGLPPDRFADACFLTLLRVDHPIPEGAKDDWLTAPAWALALPRNNSSDIPAPLYHSVGA